MDARLRRRVTPRLKGRYRPTRLLRLEAVIVLLLACNGTNAYAGQAHPLAARLATMYAPGVSWQEQQSVDMSGIPLHVRPFFSSLDATRVARALASETGRFQRLITFADTLLLTGVQADAHWLAKIDVSAAGATGYVSVLGFAATPPADTGRSLDVHAWLPANAAALYRHRSTSNGRTLDQHMYSVADTPAVSMAYVREQLRRQGWKHDPSLAGIGNGSVWHRQESQLTIFASAQSRGSALYIQHLE